MIAILVFIFTFALFLFILNKKLKQTYLLRTFLHA
jgi:hypothetical protein